MKKTKITMLVVAALAATAAFAMTGGGTGMADGQGAVTLTGCLRTGSAASVFILRGATTPSAESTPDQSDQMPRDYLLVAIPGDLDPAGYRNKRVAVTGVVSAGEGAPAPPDAANSAERALRRLSVSELKEIASGC
jgi:hypothetical protein